MVSHLTSSIILAALFISAYGMPADTTLVSTPTTMGGYPSKPAMNTTGVDAAAQYAVPDIKDPAAGTSYDVPGDSGHKQDVDDYRGRGRSPSRRHPRRHPRRGSRGVDSDYSSDCSDSSYSGYSSGRGRSVSCDSDRSASDDNSDACASSDDDGDSDKNPGHRRRHRRHPHRRHHRRPARGRRCTRRRRIHPFWFPRPMPYGPVMPYGPPRPWGVHPWDESRPWGPMPKRPAGFSGDKDQDCEDESSGRQYGNSDTNNMNEYHHEEGYYGRNGKYQGYSYGSNFSGVDNFNGRRGGNDQGFYVRGNGDYGVDDYRQNGADGQYGRNGGGRELYRDRQFSQSNYDANASGRQVDIKDRRGGRFSLDERHADEESFDRNGHERVMVDRFGQRATSRSEEVDAARRSADAQRVHISGPNGSLDHTSRSGSEDTFNSDSHERTFNGPNRRATEREFSTSTSSRDFNQESTSVVSRRRH